MRMEEFATYREAVAHIIFKLPEPYKTETKVLLKGEAGEIQSSGELIIAQGKNFLIKSGAEEKKIDSSCDRMVVAHFSPGETYYIEAGDMVSLKSLKEVRAAEQR
jgi:uncharacterized protein YjlB